MNLVLANYGEIDNNSAYHILGFARELARREHDVVVAVVKSVPDGECIEQDGFRILSHRTALTSGVAFANGGRADILHVWTPREITRQFAEAFQSRDGATSLVIHLEDNEAAIFERFTGHSLDDSRNPDKQWSKGLIHPFFFEKFLGAAQGITTVHECVAKLVPAGQPWIELPPVLDFEFFSPDGSEAPEPIDFKPSPSTVLIGYNGNDHAASIFDVMRLYEAIDHLIDDGSDIALLRTGHILPSAYEGIAFRQGSRCTELGFVERPRMPGIMHCADIVVQPGDDDEFNGYRLPAKIPEYLALGLPLIMGRTNIGIELEAAKAALVVQDTSPASIASSIKWLIDHPEERQAMRGRARHFAERRFGVNAPISRLKSFYRDCIQNSEG
jgi:glycosyltransferase involved in cell wall biosynthesis